jgi:glycosyltransferase involved in cell wall biosynthesis
VAVHLVEHQGSLLDAITIGARLGRTAELAIGRASVSARILHDHGVWLQSNHAMTAVARRAQMPRVVSPRGMISPWALNFHRMRKRVAWMLYQARDLRSAQLLHATSEDEAHDARRLGIRSPIAIIPNGVELAPVLPDRKRNGHARQALFLSRIHRKKGVRELIAAWAQTRPLHWSLVIAGPDDGGHRAEAEELVRRKGLEATVRFIGSVPNDERWRVFAEADLFILPTFSENFGIVIAEALGSGLPVITTKGAPWRVLEDRGFGWWIDVGVEPLVAAIREATALSDAERERRASRGREFVAGEFSWQMIGERMATVYRWLHGKAARPADVRLD